MTSICWSEYFLRMEVCSSEYRLEMMGLHSHSRIEYSESKIDCIDFDFEENYSP